MCIVQLCYECCRLILDAPALPSPGFVAYLGISGDERESVCYMGPLCSL